MMRLLCSRLAALAALGLLLPAAYVYPAPGLALGIGLGAYIALLLWRPQLWLLLVPALLPVLDFAPWTGWFFLEELDLLLLATCVAGYLRLGRDTPPTRLPGLAVSALLLLGGCVLIGAWRGVLPAAPLDANAFTNYLSPYNGLRVLKGFLWPLLLLPLLRHSAGVDGANIRRLLVPGMLAGLVLCSLAVVWERSAFPGLFNFSSDYRPTAPFSAMHTGGAALDAYMAMAFPFVALWLIGAQQHHARLAAGLVCLLLGIFAGFTTFSRDIYLAYTAAGAVIAVLGAAHHVRGGTLKASTMLATVVLLAVLAWLLTRVFGSSGYRGLAACIGLLGAAIVVAGAEPRLRQWPLAIGVALALLAAVGVLQLLPGAAAATSKMAYAGYILAGAACALGSVLLLAGAERQRAAGLALVLGAFPAIGLATALVANHWAGRPALPDVGLVLAAAAALAASRLLPQRPWRLDRGTLTLGFFSAIVFGTLIPIAGSYYTGSRFATVGDDVGVRLSHWSEALDMMDKDGLTQAFGQGLGRYPYTFMWNNPQGEMPGTFHFEEENLSNRFLRLTPAHHAIGFGEVLRMLQRVDMQPGHRYVLSLDIRRNTDVPTLQTMVCERWMIYPQNCRLPKFAPSKWSKDWVRLEADLPAPGAARGLLAPPLQLEIANESSKVAMDIDNVSLREVDTGRELVRNGSFSATNDHWFFSSDRDHMPWHVKNFAISQVFELGWVGGMVTVFFLIAVGAPLVARGLGGDLQAAVFLAALTGCMMVGLFDSITDVPRLTILLLLLALAGNLQPVRPKRKRRRRSRDDGGAAAGSQGQEADALIA